MFMFKSRLLVVILVVGSLTVLWSCSQTDDVVAPKSLTKIWLDADRLPTPTPGMVYGLWVSKVAYPSINDASQAMELGRFSHITSDTLIAFLDEDGVVRADSNEFNLDGDLFEYDYIGVTVEVIGQSTGLPGPVILGQSVTGSTDTIRMYFPQKDSLFDATVRCNFETPTDDNSWNDGYGLWFCNHGYTTVEIHDTTLVTVSYGWDTIQPVIGDEGDTLNLTDLRREYPDSVWYTYDTTLIDFGRNVLALGISNPLQYTHYGAKQHVIRVAGTAVPRIIKDYVFDVDSSINYIGVDVFYQDLWNLPDISSFGWKYKGWIVSEYIPAAAIGNFTPPVWDFTTGTTVIPGYTGGLLTTGTFVDEEDSDESDPFTLEVGWEVDSLRIDTISTSPLVTDSSYERFTVPKRPRFPGEDFLDVAALQAATNNAITTRPYVVTGPGSVFISLEPNNKVTDTTNFPLIAFCRSLPSGPSDFWTLINWTGTADGAQGFPKIQARIKRY